MNVLLIIASLLASTALHWYTTKSVDHGTPDEFAINTRSHKSGLTFATHACICLCCPATHSNSSASCDCLQSTGPASHGPCIVYKASFIIIHGLPVTYVPRSEYMRLGRRCMSSSSTPEMSKQWLGSATDRAALLRKWVRHLASQSTVLCVTCVGTASAVTTPLIHLPQVSMGEDANNVEMSLVREQKTTNSSTRKIMTIADMQMSNMSECRPQIACMCDSSCASACALTPCL